MLSISHKASVYSVFTTFSHLFHSLSLFSLHLFSVTFLLIMEQPWFTVCVSCLSSPFLGVKIYFSKLKTKRVSSLKQVPSQVKSQVMSAQVKYSAKFRQFNSPEHTTVLMILATPTTKPSFASVFQQQLNFSARFTLVRRPLASLSFSFLSFFHLRPLHSLYLCPYWYYYYFWARLHYQLAQLLFWLDIAPQTWKPVHSGPEHLWYKH